MNSVPNFTLRRDADGYVLHTDDGKDGCFPTLGAALDSLRALGGVTPTTMREQVLSAARACVCGDREQDYGSPENNFRAIANLWQDYLGYPVTPTDVACLMALLKIARIQSGHAKKDNWIDLAGYAACGAELELSDAI